METLNNIWTYLSPIIASFLTYFIAVKGKNKDVDIEKIKRLNIVISNLLDVWNYLGKLENFSDLKKSDLPIPFKIIPHILLSSKSLNDKSFKELEGSISLLKEYDPVTYYELSGIGNRFNEIKNNFIMPFLKAQNQNDLNKKISETYINDTIKEIEEYLTSISKHLGYRTSKRIKKKIKRHLYTNVEETKKELVENYYNFMMTLIPKDQDKPTLEEFEKELNSLETKAVFEGGLSLLANVDLEQLMKIVAENPYISVDEMKSNLGLKSNE